LLNQSDVDSGTTLLCRISYYDQRLLGDVQAPILDKYFIMSSEIDQAATEIHTVGETTDVAEQLAAADAAAAAAMEWAKQQNFLKLQDYGGKHGTGGGGSGTGGGGTNGGIISNGGGSGYIP
jgi:uncharacterized membrane protein YgcG